MTASSARSNLANCSLKKNLSSNGCKPIRVLTCTKSSCSDGHLPIGYLLPDFQSHRSNFFAPPPPPPPTQPGRKGVDTWGGATTPPKTPRGGLCQWHFWFVRPNIPETLIEFFFECKKIHLSSVPIWHLAPKTFFFHIAKNFIEIL